MDFIHLAQDRVQWQATVDTEQNFWFHKKLAIPSVAKRLLASQGLGSMELVSYKP
jgi:hypothetical protein